ncbi:hypothetical protein [Leifsonia xyli]|uniref:hypothetical protein n=1 Tax=Leifsonia xyli TaxID=1575 RepID=UPI003D67361F
MTTSCRPSRTPKKTANAEMISYAIGSWSRSLRLCMIIVAAGAAGAIVHSLS